MHSCSLFFELDGPHSGKLISAFSSWLLTVRTSPAPSSGDTFGSRGDAGGGGGQAHRSHAGGELRWGRQLQEGDVIVEVLGVVV